MIKWSNYQKIELSTDRMSICSNDQMIEFEWLNDRMIKWSNDFINIHLQYLLDDMKNGATLFVPTNAAFDVS